MKILIENLILLRNLIHHKKPGVMKRKLFYLGLIVVCINSCTTSPAPTETILAFGSCSHEYDSVQMWNHVISHSPSAWIWLGDNIYGDTEDMSVMKQKYDMQKQRASYQNLIASTRIFGIWDDHDYGVNDGGKQYPMKDVSKLLMLDFLDVPSDAEVRNYDGTYQSYRIQNGNTEIKLILLDTRYFRDSLEINVNAPPLYQPNDGTILGKDQWTWLEKELTGSEADIHIIASSIQVIPNDHGWEKWGNFPAERDRLFRLLANTKPARPIILSGDRHIAEFSKIDIDGLAYPVYEFTSSGLTHTWSSDRPEENKHRIGDLIIKKNFGLLKVLNDGRSISIEMMVYGSDNDLITSSEAIF